MANLENIYNSWKNDPTSVSAHDKKLLYDAAKDAYYNGDEIMSDAEFDKLEKDPDVNLENKGYIGSKNGNYDVKHSFIMGSLSKIQIKENLKTGDINWEEAATTISNYLNKANSCTQFETTPKLDGCSFSLEFKNVDDEAVLVSCSTRGDGEYGTSIIGQFQECYKNSGYWDDIDEAVSVLCEEGSHDILCIRGEVLIEKSAFVSKYQDKFTNPRSYVAGLVGNKWENKKSQIKESQNLHFVCYDYRVVDGVTGKFTEISWMNEDDETYDMISGYLGHIGELPDEKYCQVHEFNGKLSVDDLKAIYYDYDNYRNNVTNYALDGVVFKPAASSRVYNETRTRPVDCIAMKFLPMINTTEIIDISWSVGKTGEYIPTAIVKTFKLDGKDIKKAALHNYNYIIKHQCGIGSEVRISLAGDIIPFVYEVTKPAGVNNINLPTDGVVQTEAASGVMHLMKQFTGKDEDLNKFKASTVVLNINNVGPAASEELWYSLEGLYPEGLTNIIQLMNDDGYDNILIELGDSKSTKNIIKGLKDYHKKMTLVELISSFCFKSCGKRASELCAKIISGIPAQASSMPAIAYQWAQDTTSDNYKKVINAMQELNITKLTNTAVSTSGKTAIIMTGSPEDFGYKTKKDFLEQHPEYYETTSWKEVQILFTDDLDSNSGKMKKAQKAGIPIKLYSDSTINEFNYLTKEFDETIFESNKLF